MFLFMMIAACYGVLQLAVLGSPTRSVRIANLLLAVTVGLYGCGAVAVVLQLLYTRSVAALTSTPVGEVVRTASYTMDPIIEEVVKVLPLLILVLFRRIRAQWSLTDYLLIGAATGAGFALVEATMRWSHRAGQAVGDVFHGYTVGAGLFGGGQHIPGPLSTLLSWLPAPVGDAEAYLLNGSLTTNLHLAWSALAGFGVGLLVRGRGWQRWLGVLPWAFAALDHMAFNHELVHPGEGGIWFFVGGVRLLEHVLWLLPPALLAVAVVVDWQQLRAGKAAMPDVLLPGERTGQPSLAVLGRFATVGLPWTPFIAMRFVLVRRALVYAHARDTTVADGLLEQVRTVREQMERASDAAVWRAMSARRAQAAPTRPQGSLLGRYWKVGVSLILAVPSVFFLVLGGFPATSGIQKLMATKVVFAVLTIFSIAALAMVAWSVFVTARRMPAAFREAYADPAVSTSFRTGVGAGSLGVGLLGMSKVIGGAGATGHPVSNVHILDAISQMTNILALGLLALSLLALFAAFMGGTGGLGGALVMAALRISMLELLQMIAIAGMSVMGALGLILAMAAGGGSGTGSGEGEGSGEGSGEGEGEGESESERQSREQRGRRQEYEDKYGEEYGEEPGGDQRISDGNKMELEDSGWLKDEVPNPDVRRKFMDWLQRGHEVGEEHVHLRPGSREAAQALEEFFQEFPELRP